MQTLKMKLRAYLDSTGEVDFDLDGKKPKDSILKLPKDSGAHAIDFELNDRTGRGLQFDRGDPIWVGEDCPCPPPAGVNSNQLTIADCRPERLSTVDENSGRARELRYQLNLIAADGTRASCDPVITNGGGGQI